MYVYDRRGKREPGVDELFRHTVILKQWRGYILAALVDLFSGRPLVWKLIDASWDEAKVLKDLLHMLYTLWPDCPLEVVVGDAAYDEAWAYEWCETGYGVHLVAPRKPSLEKTQRTLHDLEAIGILKIDGLGRAVCRAHGQPLVRQSFHQGSRIGLRPGEVSQVSEFRHRLSCSHGCERLSLPASLNWSAITYYPHHSDIHPKRYAEKLAFLARRNVVESVYSGLKTMSLASSGPDRPQFRKMEEVAMLISLQFVTRTAQLVGVISAESGLRRAA